MEQQRSHLKSRESHKPHSKGYIRGSYMKVSYDAPPLDFSFKEIESLHDLLFEKQRKGRNKDRKPIQELQVNKKKKDAEKEKEGFDEESIDNDLEENASDEDKDDGSGEEDEEETKKKDEIEVGKLIPVDSHMDLANKHNISLAPNQCSQLLGGNNLQCLEQGWNGLEEEEKGKAYMLFTYTHVQQNPVFQLFAIISNFKSDLDDFYNIVDQVMVNSYNLKWIDLSHNAFSTLTDDFGNFHELRSLYLHVNFIRDMEELKKLQNIEKLRNLTIHGNPLDQLPNFRIYIIGILPQLKRLDTVLVTYKETDNAIVWRDTFKKNKLPKVPFDDDDLKKQDDDAHDDLV